MGDNFQVAGTAVFDYEVPRSAMNEIERNLLPLYENRDTQQLLEPELPLRQVIYDCSNDAWKQLGADTSKAQLQPTQVWLNRVLAGGGHLAHYHPNSVLSGILFLQTHPVPTVFQRHTLYATLPVRWWADHNTEWESTPVEARRGRLIVFPSNIHHMVPQNTTEQDRLVVAWNTFPKGEIMPEDQLCQLVL